MKQLYAKLAEIAAEFEVPEKEVHIRIGEPGFLEFWQFIETGIEKNDQWKLIKVEKI